MKAEELRQTDLRIGNIVNYKYFNPHPENPEYCHTKAIIRGVYENSIRISFHNQKRIEKVSKVYPIPLTEEILLKCGATLHGTEHIVKARDLPIKIRFHSGIAYCEFGNVYLGDSIKYIHELQNLYFALCGEELEVKI